MESKLKEKNWSKEFEPAIYEEWKKKNIYSFKKGGKTYSIDTPPPYVNTPIHIGHATTYVIQDMIARFRRMIGYNVLFPLGLDRNGLPIEIAAEKKFGVNLHDISREEFIKLCEQLLSESTGESIDSFLKLGISFNSWKVGKNAGDMYLTDSDEYRTLTQSTFIDMYEKGLIYEDERINNYCPGCQTTLADDEIAYQDVPSRFVDLKFYAKETKEEIIISTTRPELLSTCAMVIFHPDDLRYTHLEGLTAITPLYKKEVPIKSHPSADPEKGSGLVMMCSMGDQTDIRFFRDLHLKPIIAIDEKGKMNENAGFLSGLPVGEARKRMVEELKAHNLVVDERKINHRTPICERSKHPIEFISQKEFYMKQLEMKEKMREVSSKIKFFSENSRKILLDWIDAVSIDWAISRRRYYATEIPIWYCENNHVILPKKGKYCRPWKEPAPVKACPKCRSKKFQGETRVLDTWFDSSISPLYILKYDSEFFKNNFTCTLRPQGKEIVRNWLYYTLLRCYLLTKKPIFKDVWIHYHVVDEEGKKMSKSIGNVIDPKEILEKYGAEPFRFWCAVEGNMDRTDFRCSFERIEGAGKTLTKLWNVSKFVSMFPEPGEKFVLSDTDKWIIQEMNEIIKFTKKSYENYNFHEPAIRIRNFIWETFASHYLEMVKSRAYGQSQLFSEEEQAAAVYTLNYCLDNILKIMAPIIPFMTYKIYMELRNSDIHQEEFPSAKEEYKLPFTTEKITELNSLVWKTKRDNNLSLKSEISEIVLPKTMESIAGDIKACHNAKKISYGEKIEVIL